MRLKENLYRKRARLFFLLLPAICCCSFCRAQQRNNSIYLELGGSHFVYSLGYGRNLWRSRDSVLTFGLNAGVSYFPEHFAAIIDGKPIKGFSLSPSLKLGTMPNQAVFRLNYTLLTYREEGNGSLDEATYVNQYLAPQLGYRHYLSRGRLFFQVSMLTLVELRDGVNVAEQKRLQARGLTKKDDEGMLLLPWLAIDFGVNF